MTFSNKSGRSTSVDCSRTEGRWPPRLGISSLNPRAVSKIHVLFCEDVYLMHFSCGGAASRRTGGPTGRASGRNASLAIGYGATPRPWAPTAGKVVGSGRGATSPRSHSELTIDVASDGSRRAVRCDEPGHRRGRRRREAARASVTWGPSASLLPSNLQVGETSIELEDFQTRGL